MFAAKQCFPPWSGLLFSVGYAVALMCVLMLSNERLVCFCFCCLAYWKEICSYYTEEIGKTILLYVTGF